MTINPSLEKLSRQCERSITKMSDTDALKHIAQLIDDAFDASFERPAKRALFLIDELAKRKLNHTEGALAEYFRANAWAACGRILNTRQAWSWEVPELQEEMLALSRASNHPGFASLDKVRQCQILTNYANLLNTVGRTIDAVAVWDKALKIIPEFAMARGNRGAGLRVYAAMVDDNRTRAILALHAFDGLRSMMASDSLYESEDPRAAIDYFSNLAKEVASAVNIDSIRGLQDLENGYEGRSKAERAYRRWCLEYRLFLCPINDLGPHLAGATDDLMLPPLLERFDDRPNGYLPPPIVGFFSQIKQEFASARFMLFEGISSTQVHFSDLGVKLSNTLDYPH